jgi:hypothetical protein
LGFSAFRYRCPMIGYVPVATGWVGGERRRRSWRTAERFLIYRDAMGRTMKLARGVSTLPLPLDWPVRTMDDWRSDQAPLRVRP